AWKTREPTNRELDSVHGGSCCKVRGESNRREDRASLGPKQGALIPVVLTRLASSRSPSNPSSPRIRHLETQGAYGSLQDFCRVGGSRSGRERHCLSRSQAE